MREYASIQPADGTPIDEFRLGRKDVPALSLHGDPPERRLRRHGGPRVGSSPRVPAKARRRQVDVAWGDEGFTIMDGVVATFLLAIAIISVAGVIMFAVTQGSASSRATSATILAEQELEAVRDLQYDDLVNATRAVTLGTGAFVVRRTVTTTDLPSMMKRIHVEVTWGNGQRYDAETIFGYLGS